MDPMQIAVLVLVFVLVAGTAAGAMLLMRPREAQERLQQVAGQAPGERKDGMLQWAAGVAQPFGKLAAPDEGFEKSSVRLRFMHAGLRSPQAPATFFGTKTLLTLGLPLLGFAALTIGGATLHGNTLMALLLLLAALGYYGPNMWLSRRVFVRQREIFESFPDALDLMTVCVEAGLGTESALVRVAEDMHLKSPVLSEEMRLVNLELRAGADRERALRNLAIRTGVEEVDSFVTMINQAERFGTSIAASLRVHADMLRTRRRQKAEEAAAKIALKLLFPLIFCIFPSLMVVLMGPAMIQIYRVLLPTMSGGN